MEDVEYLTADEVAAKLRTSVATLARWRFQGSGPEYVKLGGRVLYTPAALKAFAEGNTRTKTREQA